MPKYQDELIRDLLRCGLSSEEIEGLQRHEKDADRFEQVLRLEQERLGWGEPILLCLQEHLYIVGKRDGSRVVRCDCGQEFGDYRRNLEGVRTRLRAGWDRGQHVSWTEDR